MDTIRTVLALFAVCAGLAGPPAAQAQDAKAQQAAREAAIQRATARVDAARTAGENAGAACNYSAWSDAQKTFWSAVADLQVFIIMYRGASFPAYPFDACTKKAWEQSHPNGPPYQTYGAGGLFVKGADGATAGNGNGGGNVGGNGGGPPTYKPWPHVSTNCASCKAALDSANAHIDVYNALAASKAPAAALDSAKAAMDGNISLLRSCEKTCAASPPAPSGPAPKPSGVGGVSTPAKGLLGSSTDLYQDVPKDFGAPKSAPTAPPAFKASTPTLAPSTKLALPAPTPSPTKPVAPTGVAPKPMFALPPAPVAKPPAVAPSPAPSSMVAPTKIVCPAGEKAVTIAGKTTCAASGLVGR